MREVGLGSISSILIGAIYKHFQDWLRINTPINVSLMHTQLFTLLVSLLSFIA